MAHRSMEWYGAFFCSSVLDVDGFQQWPYSYDTCDVGTVANQTINGQPEAATVNGDEQNGQGHLSYLPGQRLSRCTCPGEPHPGPVHKDGSYVGRAGPEIDVFEAQVNQHLLIYTCDTHNNARLMQIHSLGEYPSPRSGQ